MFLATLSLRGGDYLSLVCCESGGICLLLPFSVRGLFGSIFVQSSPVQFSPGKGFYPHVDQIVSKVQIDNQNKTKSKGEILMILYCITNYKKSKIKIGE